MDKKEKSLSELVSDAFYENCCKHKLCSKCEYDTPNFDCHILRIIKIVKSMKRRMKYNESLYIK